MSEHTATLIYLIGIEVSLFIQLNGFMQSINGVIKYVGDNSVCVVHAGTCNESRIHLDLIKSVQIIEPYPIIHVRRN